MELNQHPLYSRKSVTGFFGAPEETRTPKIWLLRPTRIPIPSPGHVLNYLLYTVYNILSTVFGTLDRTRTYKTRDLNAVPIPIRLQGH
jgi:hypothetical protein